VSGGFTGAGNTVAVHSTSAATGSQCGTTLDLTLALQ
jgi:hypothetical protein